MSEETVQELKLSEEKYSELEKKVEAYKNDFLEAVATQIPEKMEELAKKTAFSEPEVTKALGADGVKELRSELKRLAAQLAEDLSEAVSSIKWPEVYPYSVPTTRQFDSALFEYMRPKMNKFAEVFKRNGFNVHDDNARHSQGLVLPQSFYSERASTAQGQTLSAGMQQLAQAKIALEKAKKADGESSVMDLWQD